MFIRRFLKLFALGLTMGVLFSCANMPEIKKDFEWPRDTFVKYEAYTYRQECTPADPDNLKSPCYKRVTGATGSASIVARSFNGAYILTAAHMCDRSDVIKRYDAIDEELGNGKNKYLQKHFVLDIDAFKYNVKVVGFDWELDSCIVFAWGLFGPALEIAMSEPKIGEKIYNFAAPAGFFKKNLMPLFDGYFVGHWDSNTSVYTLPVIGGSSGSPVVNDQGQLVGLVYARHNRFHHIAISPKFKNLRKFIIDTIRADAKKQAKEHELDERRSIIIKFNDKHR